MLISLDATAWTRVSGRIFQSTNDCYLIYESIDPSFLTYAVDLVSRWEMMTQHHLMKNVTISMTMSDKQFDDLPFLAHKVEAMQQTLDAFQELHGRKEQKRTRRRLTK